jgi:hypothetical protein
MIYGFAAQEDVQRVYDATKIVEGSVRNSALQMPFFLPVMQPNTVVLGKTDAAINKGTFASPTSGTVSVWSGSTSFASLADTGTNITAFNFFGNISSGKQVLCMLMEMGWIIFAAEC